MADNTTVSADHSEAAPRSVREIVAVGTPQTPVASPYYNDGRNVTPYVWTFA
jgi:hypothetical protein